jgi:hypothetical protein
MQGHASRKLIHSNPLGKRTCATSTVAPRPLGRGRNALRYRFPLLPHLKGLHCACSSPRLAAHRTNRFRRCPNYRPVCANPLFARPDPHRAVTLSPRRLKCVLAGSVPKSAALSRSKGAICPSLFAILAPKSKVMPAMQSHCHARPAPYTHYKVYASRKAAGAYLSQPHVCRPHIRRMCVLYTAGT